MLVLISNIILRNSAIAKETIDFTLSSFSAVLITTENGVDYYEAEDISSRVNYNTIMGRGVEYGIVADTYYQNNHTQTNFAVKTYDRNGDDFKSFGAPTGHSVHTPDVFYGSQFAEVMFFCNGDFGNQIKTFPRCRFTGGIKIPHYEIGDDIPKFKQFLTDYVSKMTTDITSLTGYPNVCELVGEGVIITNKCDVLLNQMNIDEPNNITIDMNVRAWEVLPVVYNQYAGFVENDPIKSFT